MKLSLALFQAAFSSVLAVALGSAVYGGTIEAKKDGVEVFASADKSSAVLSKLAKGASVSAGERSGMYWQVVLPDGKKGFVSVLAVKIKADGNDGLSGALRDAVKAGRSSNEQASGRARSAVMGVRGLDDNNTAMAGSVRPNYRAVYAMEDFETPQDKLEQQANIIENDILARMQ